MGELTGIGWTDATWNPWHGCHKVSPGCDLCYMFREKRRYGQEPDVVVRSRTTFDAPLKWVRKAERDPGFALPKVCFTCSWSDFFIAEADPWRAEAWAIMQRTPQITYQVLTKRAGRILPHLPSDWGASGYPNVWLGVSVEGRAQAQRISTLRAVPAQVRFVSFEPLLEDLGVLNLSGIGWAIVGGESGGAGEAVRPMDPRWAIALREQAASQGVPFYMKQMGGVINKREDFKHMPPMLRVREWPAAAEEMRG